MIIKKHMIAFLPKNVTINGKVHRIRSDYRVALLIFDALNNPNISEKAKLKIFLDAFYIDPLLPSEYKEGIEQEIAFLDCGEDHKSNVKPKKLMDWNQDEQLIFSAINSVAGKEVRAVEYLHWWTFLGYFNEIKEGLFSTVITIRRKKAEGKKLESYEKEFYRKNKSLIDLRKRYSDEQRMEIDEINALLNS